MTPFARIPINVGQTNWQDQLNQNMVRVETFWNQPQQIRRVYRSSASGPNGIVRWLVNFPAANFTGAMVWVQDAAGDSNYNLANIVGSSFFPANYQVSGTYYKKYAYSDGVSWRWVHNDQVLNPTPS